MCPLRLVRSGWIALTISPGHCIWSRYHGSINRGVAVSKEEWTVFLAVGMSWPPPRWIALSARVTSRILTFVDRTGSSHKGPSLVAHWKPWTILGLHDNNKDLSTSLGRVSSIRILVPCVGEEPNAQTDRDDKRSQSYLVWKNLPSWSDDVQAACETRWLSSYEKLYHCSLPFDFPNSS